MRIPRQLYNQIIVFSVMISVSLIAFSLGYLSGLQQIQRPVSITKNAHNDTVTSREYIVASRHSSTYHYQWCPGAQQISTENILTFNSHKEAQDAGYKPAKNCKGIK